MDSIGQVIMDAGHRLHLVMRHPMDDMMLDFIVTGNTGRWIMGVLWNETGDIGILAMLPVFIPPDQVARVSAFLKEVNAKLRCGSFELQAGRIIEVWFVLNGDVCENGVPLQDLAFGAMKECCRTVDQHLHGLLRSIFSGAGEQIRVDLAAYSSN